MKKTLCLIIILLFICNIAKAEITSNFYRGFIGLEKGFFIANKFAHYNDLSISTTHGYQLNQHLFLGVGANLLVTQSWKNLSLPVFASTRTDWTFNRLTPYAELRAGAYFGFYNGAYLSPIVGYRFNLSRIFSLNLGAGFSFIITNKKIYYSGKYNISSFTLSASLDF